MGSELDLAGLVCNTLADQTCINPIRGIEGGDTWEDRFATIHKLDREKRDEFEAE